MALQGKKSCGQTDSENTDWTLCEERYHTLDGVRGEHAGREGAVTRRRELNPLTRSLMML